MFSRKYSKLPLVFHVNGSGSGQNGIIPPSTTSASIQPSSSSNINRFSMFRNLQNTKPCGSCGGR